MSGFTDRSAAIPHELKDEIVPAVGTGSVANWSVHVTCCGPATRSVSIALPLACEMKTTGIVTRSVCGRPARPSG